VGAQRDRPLLHASERRLRRNLMAVGAGLVFVAVILLLLGLTGRIPASGVKLEIYKLVLQLFLISGGGGMLLAFVGNIRDEVIRRQTRAAGVYELDRELDRAYRALKKTKRSLRAYANQSATPGKIPRAVFEKTMEDLLKAQLELEVICDHIGNRDDVLYRWRLKRMKAPLHYASRYYHDVHEDFERARVVLEGDYYDIAAARNLADFLRSSGEVSNPLPPAIETSLETLENEKLPILKRYLGLASILRDSPRQEVAGSDGEHDIIRYADVAGACLDLLSAELAEARTKILT
jgi:hypothetical protein